MLNLILMTLVIIIQILPNFISGSLPEDSQWQIYICSLLGQSALLSALLFTFFEWNGKILNRVAKIVAVLIFAISIYDIINFAAITSLENHGSAIDVNIGHGR